MADKSDGVSRLAQEYYCGACNTWYPTDGASTATALDLWNELFEHQAEIHD